MTDRDPKIVLQAHTLRVAITRRALLHGSYPVRTMRTGLGGLWASLVLSGAIVIVVIVTTKIVTLLHSTGH